MFAESVKALLYVSMAELGLLAENVGVDLSVSTVHEKIAAKNVKHLLSLCCAR